MIHGVRLGGTSRLGFGSTSAQKAGLRYEHKVICALHEKHRGDFLPSPEIYFSDDRGAQMAIPDGLFVFPAHTIVLEIKYQHMPEAWWQLRKKYEPIVRKLFPTKPVHLLEICRSYDVQMPFPEKVKLYASFEDYHEHVRDGELGVLQWKL